ncbi:GNAT family N-acetyltransferase [Zhouia sp. PK063]|uniref:GNAT family N-acetyltransferase n=1 Tax=Zhouia sp. PK063 TaxID=3373602 RepID=UPI0037B78B2A
MIRKATAADIDNILQLTKACASAMIAKNIYQWNEKYPSRAAFETDVARNELFVLEIDENIVGCIVISTFMDEVYHPVKWLTPNTENHFYIHRLGVHPDFQGNGYAQALMHFAENMGVEANKTSIRLDTFSKNPKNLKFYEARGFERLEEIYFKQQSEYSFYCYEKILS